MRRDFELPGARAHYAPDRTYDVQHIKLAVTLDIDDCSVRGTCSLTLVPIGGASGWLRLDAVELDIHRVSWDGRKLSFSHDGSVLRIDLREVDTERPTSTIIDIEYSGSPRRGLYFVGPDDGYPDKPVQVWSQGQDEDSRFWFPCFDSPHEKATSEVIATVPETFFALSNGTLIDDMIVGDQRRMHWRFDTPHSCYLITLVAGQLSELRDAWEDVEVTYYAAPGRDEDVRRTLGKTPEMLALFSETFGISYPYEKYAQVFVADFIFGGMENTTATTLTDVVILDERAAIDYDVEALVAHELAHQWFGDLLTCRDWGEGWLNEGFATYSEYVWRDHAEGRDAADIELADWAESYFREDAKRYRRKVATKVYDEPIDIFDSHLYEKGGRVLHMLRNMLGDELFWQSIAHYLTKHSTGSVETRDLARAIEAATGRVFDWFFAQWITDSAGHPELEVGYAWDADRKLARLSVTQTHKTDNTTPLFRLPTSVRFRVDGDDRDFDIEITDKQHTLFFALDSEPTQAIFDPGKVLLAKVKTDKGIQLIEAELASASLAIDRIHAAEELARRGGRRATDALTRGLTSDPFWGVRAACAKALGELRTDRALDALLANTATEHPKARRAVVEALGAFRKNLRASEALAALVEDGDVSYYVEAEACLALGKIRSPRAAELLRQACERDSYTDIIRRGAYAGLAELRDDSAISLLRDGTAYGRVSRGRRAALKALSKLAQGRRDRDARDIRELGERLLFDSDVRVQMSAIEALAKIGDPAAIPALQRLVDRNLDGRLRRRAREAIRDITEGTAQSEQIKALNDELETLRGDVIKLRERLDQLDAAAKQKRKKRKKNKRKKSH